MIQGALLSRPVASRHGIFFWLLRNFVKLRYSFFLMALLLGIRRRSVEGLLVWVAVVFVAVLLHELGHALAARRFRQDPQIELHLMGGTTSWAERGAPRWHESIAISLAGPGIGLMLGGWLYWYAPLSASAPYLLQLALYDFRWVSLAWGAFNLLPLLPLDGGHVLDEVLQHRLGRDRGRTLARKVSCATGVAGVLAGVVIGETWAAVLCGMLAYDNLQRLRGLPGVALPR